MTQTFYKYQGTGNDFILIDNRLLSFDKNDTKHIKFLCDRRFGIGADGLILLELHEQADFKMVYFNSDGSESSMCGNGGRCIVAFAKFLGIVGDHATFEAVDGFHQAQIDGLIIKLQMQDVDHLKIFDSHVFLDTGSPHHVQMEPDLAQLDVKKIGASIRYGEPYKKIGTNVNFVSKVSDDVFSVRTYERGVEDETLSCGTGVTAVALAMNFTGKTDKNKITLNVEGGTLQVSFDPDQQGFKNIWLMGPAVQVFKGEI